MSHGCTRVMLQHEARPSEITFLSSLPIARNECANFTCLKFEFFKLFFTLSALSIIISTGAPPAHAQYYLVDSKQESPRDAYQNVDYIDLSGVTTNVDDYAPGSSDNCMNGFMSTFLSIAGVCIGLPLIGMFVLKVLIGSGVRSARMPRGNYADLYLEAPQLPTRWYDPLSKSLLETVRK